VPIYEYRCADCGDVSTVFVRSPRASVDPVCTACGSRQLTRMMSAVARLRTDQDVLDEYGRPGQDGRPADGYRDPRQIGRWVEERFEQYGLDLPPETRDMIAAAREGELPGPVDEL
jgi:putative FmdB family regulatory protein